MKTSSSLTETWREISPYLDAVLELEPEARSAWLDELAPRRPEIAHRLRAYLADLAELDHRNFLCVSAATALIGARGAMFERAARALFVRSRYS